MGTRLRWGNFSKCRPLFLPDGGGRGSTAMRRFASRPAALHEAGFDDAGTRKECAESRIARPARLRER